MIIGVPTEIKTHEYRVALTPAAAREVVEHGHQVILQAGAGEGTGHYDDDYVAQGARIVPTAEDVFGDEDIAKVSVIGVGMKDHSGVASKMFTTLAAENINIILISTSEIRISCIIAEKYTELAVRVLHTAFGLDVRE